MADQSNSGRNALIIGAVFGLAAAGLGGYTMSSGKISAPATEIASGKNDNSLAAQAQAVKDSLKADRTIKDTAPQGAKINGEPRLAPLFFSTELWQITLDAEQKNTIIDIYDPASKSLHGDVPNTWFIANGIADALGRSDGLDIDSDNDGFTNREEFEAKTAPNDAKQYPNLVRVNEPVKMVVEKKETADALITLEPMFATASPTPAEVKIRLFKNAADQTPYHQVSVKPGESFDLDPASKGGRFKVKSFDKKAFTDFGGNAVNENVVCVIDTETASEQDKEFVIRAGKPTATAKKGTAEEKGHRISDKTITLRVTSGSAAGTPEGTKRVQLNARFLIPGGNCNGAEVAARVESINADGSVMLRVEGLESPVNVPKAAGKPASNKK